mmetsp:Transcript_137165/g.382600  ORF Transcript_137165/g.382600 Transcript_137165/m.382600 type:complete len:203 (+) Transcript_137165:609-1217(+)
MWARCHEVEVLCPNARDEQLARVVHEAKARGRARLNQDKNPSRTEAGPELLHQRVARWLPAHLHLHVRGNDQVEPLCRVVEAPPPLHLWQLRVCDQVPSKLRHVLGRFDRNGLLESARPDLLRCGKARCRTRPIVHDAPWPEVRSSTGELVEHAVVRGPGRWIPVGHVGESGLGSPEHLEELVPAVLLVRNSQPPHCRVVER